MLPLHVELRRAGGQLRPSKCGNANRPGDDESSDRAADGKSVRVGGEALGGEMMPTAGKEQKMRERHGIADAKRCNGALSDGEQSVLVTDGIARVILTISSTDAAGLTPDQADAIAGMLVSSAERVRSSMPTADQIEK